MLKRSVVFLVLTAILAQSLPAYAQARGPAGRAFISDEAVSAADYARRILNCRTRSEIRAGNISPDINLSCEALVESFNALADLEDVASHQELAEYIRGLEYRPCPTSAGSVRIARGIIVNGQDAVDYISRPLREGEFCLLDRVRNRVVSSAFCGQWLLNPIPNVFTDTANRPAPGAAPPSFNPREEIDRAARENRPEGDDDRDYDRDGPAWYSWDRKTGKAFWILAPLVGAYVGRGLITGDWWLYREYYTCPQACK